MRNLKRAFSLVLALVMAMSMVTIAPITAADTTTATVTSNFSDAAEINPDYMEAVAITGGIGLFAGTDGKFLPKGTVTRAQMATIMVKMLYGNANADSFKGGGKFIDTAYFESGWADGYINWCATLGVVAGYGDGTFKPGNQVTTAEAATMILNALKIDAGEGTWPNTVMAKAQEEGLFEGLKPMPGTNVALTREELAVIALNGLNWSDSNETGWYVTTNDKLVFDTYKSALAYAGGDPEKVCELQGRDTLARDVYDLKSLTGWITANQATGEKYTAVTVDFASDPVKFNVATDASMIGHKVKVWYKETWSTEKKPGETYAVSEMAEYITLTEAAENTKEYKAAFGTKYDYTANSLVVTDGAGYVAANGSIPTIDGISYEANGSAPIGTYVIDNESGDLCGYITPTTYTAAKIGYVDTTEGSEQILVGSMALSNSEDDDEVVEYDGIAKDDYVVYSKLQQMYVLTKLEMVTGMVSKVRTVDGKTTITVDGKEYTQSSVGGTISNTMTASNLDSVSYEEVYTFYLDPYGKLVCYEVNEGSGFDLANTFYVMGVITKTEADSYGQESTSYFARGIDMSGNEAMIPIGQQKAGSELVGTTSVAETDTFYSVEDADETEAKKLGLKQLVSFPTAYNAKDPTATYVFKTSSYGRPSSEPDWWEGGQFEYGVAEQFANNGTLEAGIYCYNHKGTKYIIVEGEYDQDYPLETSVSTGTITVKFAKQVNISALFTRQTNGTNNIEAMIFPMDVDHGLNATMVYVDKDHTTPAGTTSAGNMYEVHDALTGEAMEITLSDDIDAIPVGFYSVGYDADEELYKLAVDGEGTPIKVPAAESETYLEQRYRTDGRYFESVVYDVSPTAYTSSTIWYSLNGSIASSACSGIKVIDSRTDEQVTKDGVPRITSLDQVWALKDSMPWVTIELDMCHTYSPSKFVTAFVEVYNNRAYGLDTLVYANEYYDSEVTVVSGQLHGMGDTIALPTGVTAGVPGFYWLGTGSNGAVSLAAADLNTEAGVAFGTTDGLPAYDAIFNTTGISALDTVAGFRRYGVVEYALLSLEEQDVLLVMGAGAEDQTGLNSIEEPVVAAEYDSVVDTTGNSITLANIENKQKTLCLVYSTYDMASGTKLLVVDEVDAGITIDNDNAAALDDLTGADVIDNSGNGITSVAGLKSKISDGYVFSAKQYEVGGNAMLVITQCVKGSTVSGTLTAASFNNGVVKLTDATSLGTGLTVTGDWTIDLNGQTLSGTGAPYFTVPSGKSLTIMDSAGGGKIQGIEATDAMILIQGGSVTLNGGTLTGHVNKDTNGSTTSTIATEVGGAVAMRANYSTFIMNDGTITGNTAERGGAIASWDGVSTGSVITINGGSIVDNTSTYSSGGTSETIYTQSNATLNINGGTVGYGTTASAAGFWLRNTTVKITGAPKVYGMKVDSTCTLSVTGLAAGAYIEENGGVTATTDSTVVLTGKVYTCSADVRTITVVPAANGTVTVSATSVAAGDTVTVTATPAAGYALEAILVDGEAITGNTFEVTKNHKVTATFTAIDYTVDKGDETNGTFTLSAATANYGDTITIETAPDAGFAVESVLINDSASGVTEVVKNEKYTFTMPDGDVTVKVVFGQPSYGITKADATNGTVAVSTERAVAGTEITITATPADGYEVDTVTVTGASGTVTVADNKFTMPAEDVTVTVTFKVEVLNVITASDFTSGGTLKLTKNSTVGNGITLAAGTYTLDLNGYTLKADKAPYITVGSGVTLTIVDSGSAGKVEGLASATDSMFKVTGGQLNLQSGTLTGNIGAANGGAVYVKAGKFVMSGGTISNNSTTAYGGAIYLDSSTTTSSTFQMSAGLITGNKSVKGGAISSAESATANCTLSISGGEITGNDATSRGATMHLFDTDVTITGGKIGWGYVNGSAASASHAETEFRANCVVIISGGEFDEVGTQGNSAAASGWNVTIKGNPVIAKLLLMGNNTTATTNKCSIGELTSGASITLGGNAPTGVTIGTDSTVKLTGTANTKGAVYAYNG